jgi:hypothetical protein
MWLIGNTAVAKNKAAALRSGRSDLSWNDGAGGFDDQGEAGFLRL